MKINKPESLPLWVAEDQWHDDEIVIRFSEYQRLQTEIERLQGQCEELHAALIESRANDRQAMQYLSQVRAIIGGKDFPDMIARIENLWWMVYGKE